MSNEICSLRLEPEVIESLKSLASTLKQWRLMGSIVVVQIKRLNAEVARDVLRLV